MNNIISSSRTFFYKFIFSSIWIGGFGLGTLMMFVGRTTLKADAEPGNFRWKFLLAWIIASPLLWWFCGRLKRVGLSDRCLCISNYLVEIIVPLQEVVDVREIPLSTNPIVIEFRSKTRFGWTIMFMPKTRFSILSAHPIVAEIWKAVELAKSRD